MPLLEKHLVVKKSILPGAGKGLFTKVFIPKGTRICEYKGRILTWKQVENMPDDSYGYVFWFSNRYVIDAWKTKKGVAQLANDANGLQIEAYVKNVFNKRPISDTFFVDEAMGQLQNAFILDPRIVGFSVSKQF